MVQIDDKDQAAERTGADGTPRRRTA